MDGTGDVPTGAGQGLVQGRRQTAEDASPLVPGVLADNGRVKLGYFCPTPRKGKISPTTLIPSTVFELPLPESA